jgi:hypothetical protein
LKALAGLFGQVLKLCEQAGLVKLGHVALGGTKIKANPSKQKTMSCERMKEKRAAELEAEVERWLSAAEGADAEEDRAFGRDKSGEELPRWAADKKKRAEKIRAAKAELEAEAKAAAAAKAKVEAEAEERRSAGGGPCDGAGDCRPWARREAERSTSTGADRRCDQSQFGQEAGATVGGRRLLLRRQPLRRWRNARSTATLSIGVEK